MVRRVARLAMLAMAVSGCSTVVAGTPTAGPVSTEPTTRTQWAELNPTEDRQRKRPHGLKVHRGEESGEVCIRFLRFPDDLWLTFIADTFLDDNEPEGDWCPLADAMVDVAVGLVGSGQVRHFIWDEKSVAGLDACDVIKPEVVASKLGLPKAQPLRFPSGHECSWGGFQR